MTQSLRAKMPSSRRKPVPEARRRSWLSSNTSVAWLILCALLIVYHLDGAFDYVGDAEGNVFLPVSVLNEGNVSFTPSEMPFMFRWQMHNAKSPSWRDRALIQELRNKGQMKLLGPNYNIVPSLRVDPRTGEKLFINSFGPGAGLTALPFFALVHLAKGDLRDHPRLVWFTGKSVASLLAAASAALIFLIAVRFLTQPLAVLLALSYGLGTGVWSTSSQTLWQHAPNEFFLALGCYFLSRGVTEDRRLDSAWSGVAFGCAAACRPTSAIVGAVVALYLAASHRKILLAYLAGVVPIGLALCGYNAYYLGSPLNFGQTEAAAQLTVYKTGQVGVWQTPVWLGMLGLLVSPSRGLFVFSPFLLFAVGGLWRARGRSEFRFLRPLSVALLLILVVESKHFDWWGGWSYGYRHIVDTVVFLSLLLIPVMDWIAARRIRLAAFVLLLVWSVAVQFLGAFANDVVGWNARLAGYELRVPGRPAPVTVESVEAARALVASRGATLLREVRLDVDLPENHYRLWSLSDNEIAYYATHFRESREGKLARVAYVGD